MGAVSSNTFATIFGSDLIGWYDASDAASITHVAGAVSQWNDKSGLAHHLVQATGARQPAYSATGLGGSQPSIQFNSDMLETPAAGFATSSSTDFSVFLVGRALAGWPNYCRLVSFTANGETEDHNNAASVAYMLRQAALAGIEAQRNGADKGGQSITLDTTFRGANIALAGTITSYVNNTAGGSTADANGALGATGKLALGAIANTAVSGPFVGHICEVAILKIGASAGQRATVDAMLAAKWTV